MNKGSKILVVDDDPRIRELLRTALETEQFSVLEASSSDELYRYIDSEVIDLITLDVLLDQENGLDLIRDIRRFSHVPIILVTARLDLIDTVVGLELGADDYITKPFQIKELIARVRSVLRRSRLPATGRIDEPHAHHNGATLPPALSDQSREILKFGNWTINIAARELRNADDVVVSLTSTEFDLLKIFATSPQRVLSREHLMEQLTGREWHPSDRIIDNHVAQLRKKLDGVKGDALIKTVRGAGYLFAEKTSVYMESA